MLIRETFIRGTAYDLREVVTLLRASSSSCTSPKGRYLSELLLDTERDLDAINRSAKRGRELILRLRVEDLL